MNQTDPNTPEKKESFIYGIIARLYSIFYNVKNKEQTDAQSSKKENISIPESILYYMAKNPITPEVYFKLAKSCKYFFKKNPILIVARIHDGGRKICSNNEDDCRKINGKCCVNIDINKITIKIWLTFELELCDYLVPNIAYILPSKIYQCSESAVFSLRRIIIIWEDFKSLASKFQKLCPRNVEIIYGNRNPVMLEDILESVPNITSFDYKFTYENPAATASTMKNILKLKNLDNLQYLCLSNIPEVINLDDLSTFIMNHKDTKFALFFTYDLTEAFNNQLRHFFDIIKRAGLPNISIAKY